MLNLKVFLKARGIGFILLAFSLSNSQNFTTKKYQYLWSSNATDQTSFLELSASYKSAVQISLNSWNSSNPNLFFHSFTEFDLKSSQLKFLSTYRSSSEFTNKSYSEPGKELVVESSNRSSVLKSMHYDSLYTEEMIWFLIPKMLSKKQSILKVWLLETLSNSSSKNNDPVYSEFKTTDSKHIINDIECIYVEWFIRNNKYGIYVSLTGEPKILKLELQNKGVLELKKVDLMVD